MSDSSSSMIPHEARNEEVPGTQQDAHNNEEDRSGRWWKTADGVVEKVLARYEEHSPLRKLSCLKRQLRARTQADSSILGGLPILPEISCR
jgi:hypothetical protein